MISALKYIAAAIWAEVTAPVGSLAVIGCLGCTVSLGYFKLQLYKLIPDHKSDPLTMPAMYLLLLSLFASAAAVWFKGTCRLLPLATLLIALAMGWAVIVFVFLLVPLHLVGLLGRLLRG